MRRIETLDALRALAALAVVFFHIKELGAARLGNFMWFGWIGVDLFLVLSGFFIGIAVLSPREWNPGQFCVRRLRRIIPAYYVSLFIIVILINPWILVNVQGLEVFGQHLLLLHSLFPNSAGGINGVYWTLGLEFYFYLLMLISAPLLRSRFWHVTLLVWLGVCYAWRAWVMWYGPDDGNARIFIVTQMPGMLDLFVIGTTLAWLSVRGYLSRWGKAYSKPLTLIFMTVGSVGFAWCIWYLAGAENFWYRPFTLIVWRTLLGLSFGSLVLAFIFLDASPRFRALLSFSGLSYLGRISYSIYLYHIPVILSLQRAEVEGFPTSNWKMAVMMTAVVILTAMVSYHLVEEPWHHPKRNPTPNPAIISRA